MLQFEGNRFDPRNSFSDLFRISKSKANSIRISRENELVDSMTHGICSPFISDESLDRIIAMCVSQEVSNYKEFVYVGDYIMTSSDEIEEYLKSRDVDVRHF